VIKIQTSFYGIDVVNARAKNINENAKWDFDGEN